MYCWSCGTLGAEDARYCQNCGVAMGDPNGSVRPGSAPGASPARAAGTVPPGLSGLGAGVGAGIGTGAGTPIHWTARSPLQLRSCPACGFRGEGIPYFRRAGNLALLAAATLFTYGIGGLAYWLIKRSDRVCPSCGLGWDRSRPLGEGLAFESASGAGIDPSALRPRTRGPASAGEAANSPAFSSTGLPSGGGVRRFAGVALGLLGLLLLGLGVATPQVVPAVVGGVIGLSGAASFGWGWRALQGRRQTLLQRMQREVIRIARLRGGRLTATDVAAEMDLALPAAERVLLSLDDGFRVSSDVSDEGILYFDFREIRLGPGEPKA